MVIDELIVIENGEQKKVDSADNKTVDIISFNGVDYHFAKENEGLNGVCKNAVAELIIDLQIKGNSIQDGEPSPETPVEVESVGNKTKNLFNIQLFIDKGAIKEDDGSYYFQSALLGRDIVVWENKDDYVGQLTISYKVKYGNGTQRGNYFVFSYEDGTSVEVWGRHTTEYFDVLYTSIKDKKVTKIETTYGTTTVSTNFMDVQLEYGSEKTEYEPYGYKIPISNGSTTTNIYLNEPLRKIGNHSDYIDYKNKKVYRVIGKGQITDGTKLSMFSSVTNFSIFFTDEPNLIDYGDEYKYNPPILSETFKFCACSIGNSNSFWTANYEIGSSVTATYKRICFSLPNTITSTTMAKEWLAENPIDYIYISNAFVEEPINIPEISTADGTNVFSVNTEVKPSEFKVNYWKQILAEEVEEEIDNILQTGSNILIVTTGAEITQSGTNLVIGG